MVEGRRNSVTLSHLGATRSCRAHDHLLVTPDTHVEAAFPGIEHGDAIVHIAPALGARFTLLTVRLNDSGTLSASAPYVERFLAVLSGQGQLTLPEQTELLVAGDYVYLPPEYPHTLAAYGERLVAIVLDKPYCPPPHSSVDGMLTCCRGRLVDGPGRPLVEGSPVIVRQLVPDHPAFDLAVNVMEFPPGAALPFVEVHVMEHGLVMLEGQGIYRLGEHWHPVQAGDVIWMAPYCPQWFAALGERPARYLIYKDWNRHPLSG
ncbi:MAG: (S)-ureidoglycine aminohydrolase [Thermorudis peleae]|nr:(S)-ureidoglycine aminohydrolase [Thermorudis peleae]